MAYFGTNLQNAKNIRKMAKILAMRELINKLENHFINEKQSGKTTKQQKQQIYEKRRNFEKKGKLPFLIF